MYKVHTSAGPVVEFSDHAEALAYARRTAGTVSHPSRFAAPIEPVKWDREMCRHGVTEKWACGNGQGRCRD